MVATGLHFKERLVDVKKTFFSSDKTIISSEYQAHTSEDVFKLLNAAFKLKYKVTFEIVGDVITQATIIYKKDDKLIQYIID